MKIESYERKINDIIEKCPIEAGVEILAYNLLDVCIDDKKYSLVDISRIWRNQDSRLNAGGVVPDLAILSKDFVFENEEKGRVYGFVEVKKPTRSLRETSQIKGEIDSTKHFIYTNGLAWKVYETGKTEYPVSFNLIKGKKLPYSEEPVVIDNIEYKRLIEYLKGIEWNR